MKSSARKNVLFALVGFCTMVPFSGVAAEATSKPASCGKDVQAPFNVNLIPIAPNLPSEFNMLTVKNLVTVINFQRSFGFNSQCQMQPGGTLHVIKEAAGELLVKFSSKLGNVGPWCPDDTISLVSRERFQEIYKCNQSMADEEAAAAKRILVEKAKIRAMLAK
jgi:hypothetical protein